MMDNSLILVDYGDEIVPSYYETISTPLDTEIAVKICELLDLDPNEINALTIECDGSINGKRIYDTVLTVKRVKKQK
jgi:hypothetical protein